MAENQVFANDSQDITANNKVQGMGDVWADRVYGEWPRMKGFEVSEEEYEEWMKKEGYTS